MRSHGSPRSVALTMLGLFVLAPVTPCAPEQSAVQQQRVPSQFLLTGTLPRKLRESSGVAVSRSHPGVLWTHNDSGEGPNVFAINLAGEELGEFDVRRARSRDWEDIALGPCPEHEGWTGDCLFIADTGNNGGGRDRFRIFVVPEPEPPTGDRDRKRDTERSVRIDFRLSGAPTRADIEAMAVDQNGDVTLISKGRHGPVSVFRLSRDAMHEALDREDTVQAELVGTLALSPQAGLGRLVTGAAVSPSGASLVVRTYTELYFYRRAPDGTLTLDGAPCFLGLVEPQGEAVDYLDEGTLVLTSEAGRGRPGTVYQVRC